jgi:CheY-like chemotaxis protein
VTSATLLRVLVVDDEPFVLRSTKRWLERYMPVEVIAAQTSAAALAICRAERIDVAVVDWTLSGLSCRKLIGAIEQLQPHVQCIVWTAGLHQIASAWPVVRKPEPNDLLAAIQRLRRHLVRSSGVLLQVDTSESADEADEAPSSHRSRGHL